MDSLMLSRPWMAVNDRSCRLLSLCS